MLLNGIWQEITEAVVNNWTPQQTVEPEGGWQKPISIAIPVLLVMATVAAISLLYLRKRRNTGYTYSENIGSDAVIKVSQLK